MTPKKIIIGIAGAAIVGGLTQAASYYPNLVGIFTPASALVLAVVAYFNGIDNNE
uniref:Uncharacterized protein n=1 Tax=viral metagenome TaxID=1070528 RepID=A0A6M3LNU5_9ZZZZ